MYPSAQHTAPANAAFLSWLASFIARSCPNLKGSQGARTFVAADLSATRRKREVNSQRATRTSAAQKLRPPSTDKTDWRVLKPLCNVLAIVDNCGRKMLAVSISALDPDRKSGGCLRRDSPRGPSR